MKKIRIREADLTKLIKRVVNESQLLTEKSPRKYCWWCTGQSKKGGGTLCGRSYNWDISVDDCMSRARCLKECGGHSSIQRTTDEPSRTLRESELVNLINRVINEKEAQLLTESFWCNCPTAGGGSEKKEFGIGGPTCNSCAYCCQGGTAASFAPEAPPTRNKGYRVRPDGTTDYGCPCENPICCPPDKPDEMSRIRARALMEKRNLRISETDLAKLIKRVVNEDKRDSMCLCPDNLTLKIGCGGPGCEGVEKDTPAIPIWPSRGGEGSGRSCCPIFQHPTNPALTAVNYCGGSGKPGCGVGPSEVSPGTAISEQRGGIGLSRLWCCDWDILVGLT